MVARIEQGDRRLCQCEECGLGYETQLLAQAGENHCRTYLACSLRIASQAVYVHTPVESRTTRRERLKYRDGLAGMRPEEFEEVISQLPPDEQAALRRIVDGAAVNSQENGMLATLALIDLAILPTTFLPTTRPEDKPMPSSAELAGVGEKGPE